MYNNAIFVGLDNPRCYQ